MIHIVDTEPLPAPSAVQVANEDAEATIARLAKLDDIEYDRIRLAEAPRLGIRAATLDRERARARGEGEGDPCLFPDIVPAAVHVDGAELLDEITAIFTRYLVLPTGAADAMALWVLHAHAHDTAEISPILTFTSPTPECGKTTALNLIGAMVPKPLTGSNITAAAVFRSIEKWSPTLLVDEADTFLKDGDELRGVLNSGHSRRAAFVLRVTGDNHEPARFKTWAPKTIGLIGKLPPTLASRSIHIEMRRMAPDEKVEPVRIERLDFTGVLQRAARWVKDKDLVLRDAEPEIPGSLTGRRADNWRHLLAIADIAGGGWPPRARRVAESLSATSSEQTTGIILLEDIAEIFAETGDDRVTSTALVAKLVDSETRPWGEWAKGKPITVRQVARLLSPFKIAPSTIRTGAGTAKGYHRHEFQDAFARYLGSDPSQRHNPQKTAENQPPPSVTLASVVTDGNGRKPAENLTCDGVTDDAPVTADDVDRLEREAIQSEAAGDAGE